jgi:hypothetical protein
MLSSLALYAHISAHPGAGIDIAPLAVKRGSAARFLIGKTQECRIGQLIGNIGIQVRAQPDQRSGERPPPSTAWKLRVQYEDIHQSPRGPSKLRVAIVRNAVAYALRSLNECASARGTGGGQASGRAKPAKVRSNPRPRTHLKVPRKPCVRPLLSTYSPTISPASLIPKARVCRAPGKSNVSTPRAALCTKP